MWIVGAAGFVVLSSVGCYDGLPEGRGTLGSGELGESAGGDELSTDTSAEASSGATNTGSSDTAESGPADEGSSADEGSGSTSADAGDGDGAGDGEGSSSGEDGSESSTETGPNPNLSVCERWNLDRAALSEGSWDGAVGGCDPGDMDPAWRDRTLTQINLYRWLADLPPVGHAAERDDKAQACALIMQGSGQLSHSPPNGWACWTEDGNQAAGSSNIAGTAAVAAMDLYMIDYGNETTMGHRRWILSNSLGPTGIGSTSGYSCLWVIGGNGNAGKEWMAWPSPGEFPLQAIFPGGWNGGLNGSGWTIQSDSIDLSNATVTVTRDGMPQAVNVVHLLGGYGSSAAINLVPQGWTAQAGATYHVEVSNVNPPISYDVDIVDCG